MDETTFYVSQNKETLIINSMSVYHFIRYKPSGGFLTMVNRESRPMYMCFKDKVCADRCRTHFAKFKHEHKAWPSIDLSTYQEIAVQPDTKESNFTLSYIYNQMIIDTIQEDDLIDLGSTTGILFMYCHEFGILSGGNNKLNVMFSGQEIEIEPEPDKFIDWMEEHKAD